MAENAQAADHGHDNHGDGHHDHHDVSFYYKTYAVLVVLFVISFIGPWIGEATGVYAITLFTAFGIAVVKAAKEHGFQPNLRASVALPLGESRFSSGRHVSR